MKKRPGLAHFFKKTAEHGFLELKESSKVLIWAPTVMINTWTSRFEGLYEYKF